MKQFKFATSILIGALLFSTSAFSYTGSKDDVIASDNWTGLYAGLNFGYVKHTMNITDVQAATFYATIQQAANPRITGGFQAGMRKQVDLAIVSGVYGIEFSGNYTNSTFKKEYGSPFALYQISSQNRLKSAYLLQLTGGIAANRTLLFVAGGLSWIDIKGNVINMAGTPFFDSFSLDKTQIAGAVSGGIEYAFTDRISARLKIDVLMPDTYMAIDNVNNNYQISNNIIQSTLGLNYKFG